ncbi:hypothetical protein EVAR_95166_1 [Eumeta japonica]|uniref:Uncharacterized protein n=1 Tax=Eumeta variegata TaxID=151549 RepID=A0A4C1VHT0_EUMVA|nr:hypothetical protein EVAR_95166_1 [Eumeta japonica]
MTSSITRQEAPAPEHIDTTRVGVPRLKCERLTPRVIGTSPLVAASRHLLTNDTYVVNDLKVAEGRELNIKSVERGARRPYIGYGSFVWNIGVCGACEADGGRGCPTWPVIQRASLNASLFGSPGHLGASLQRSLGRTSFVLDVLHTAVFTSWKVAGMYSVSMIQASSINESALLASYKVAYRIVKTHTIAENLILPAALIWVKL